MRQTRLFFFSLLLVLFSSVACKTDRLTPADQSGMPTPTNPADDSTSSRLKIKVGSMTFTATLLSNPTVTAFKARLPLTLSMRELNGNEKFVDLPNSLPTNATNPGTIQAGDLTLYGSTTLVLFYEIFKTAYSYTKLGRIDNPTGLAAALGTGSVTVTFELDQ